MGNQSTQMYSRVDRSSDDTEPSATNQLFRLVSIFLVISLSIILLIGFTLREVLIQTYPKYYWLKISIVITILLLLSILIKVVKCGHIGRKKHILGVTCTDLAIWSVLVILISLNLGLTGVRWTRTFIFIIGIQLIILSILILLVHCFRGHYIGTGWCILLACVMGGMMMSMSYLMVSAGTIDLPKKSLPFWYDDEKSYIVLGGFFSIILYLYFLVGFDSWVWVAKGPEYAGFLTIHLLVDWLLLVAGIIATLLACCKGPNNKRGRLSLYSPD